MIEEKEIISLAQTGSESAFTELVKRHQNSIYMLALRLMFDRDEALEVSQLAFIQAYKNLKSFRGEASLSTWLYRITYNIAMRKLKLAKLRRYLPGGMDILNNLPSSDSASKEAEKSAFRQNLAEALEKLPPQMRAVFTMHQVQGLKLVEVAEIMRKSVGNIKALHYHAVRKLRESLKDWQYAEFSS